MVPRLSNCLLGKHGDRVLHVEEILSLATVLSPIGLAEIDGEPGDVQQWVSGNVSFPVAPLELNDPGARLVGARLSHVMEREAAAFFYDVQGSRVTVLMFPADRRVDQIGALLESLSKAA